MTQFTGGIPFAGGTPYALDVKKLMEQFPVGELTEGRTIRHEELVAVLANTKRGSSRYYGVINSWLHKLKKEYALIVIWQHKTGLIVPPPSELYGHVKTRHGQKRRQTIRVSTLYRYVNRDRLADDRERQNFDYETTYAARLAHLLSDSRKDALMKLTPIESLPKRSA